MDRDSLPQISPFNLRGSLRAAECMAAQAQRTSDVRLQRSLLTAGCHVLDFALRSAEPAARSSAAR